MKVSYMSYFFIDDLIQGWGIEEEIFSYLGVGCCCD